MHKKLLFTTILVLVVVGAAMGFVKTERPDLVRMNADKGSMSGQSGANGYPQSDSVMVVCNDIDYAGQANGPTAYAAQRHIAFGKDSYYIIWEWGDTRDNDVTESHWESFGPIGYWTFPVSMNGWGENCGRPSITAGSGDRMIAAWHQNNGDGYDIYAGYNDGTGWNPQAITDTTDTSEDTFVASVTGSDGKIWLGYDANPSGSVEYFYVTNSDDNGETWAEVEQVTPFAVLSGWAQCALAADPSNGDIWMAYHDTTGGVADNGMDVVVHRYDSASETWGDRMILDEGYPEAHPCLPSIVVDSNHDAHVTYIVNPNPTLEGLQVYYYTGPIGPLKYIHGHEGDWSTPELVTGGSPTDSTSGMPSLGIDANDNLYLAFTQIDSTDGEYLFNTFNSYMTTKTPTGDWSERLDLSRLGAISPSDSFHCMYAHITQVVPEVGPGITWGRMVNYEVPSAMCFNRPFESSEVYGGAPRPDISVRLLPNHPNPFNPVTTIGFNLDSTTEVNLAIYDITGKLVKTLVTGEKAAGSHQVVWNGTNEAGRSVASGMYFSRLTAGSETQTKSMMLLK